MRTVSAMVLSALAAVTFAMASPTASAADACAFELGFTTLHDLLPAVVGDCTDNVGYNPDNGDALQHTVRTDGTPGLLVWRKLDNFTAFTDGGRTWVNGPFGVQSRWNDQRLTWEPNPDRLAIVPPPAPGDACHTAGLELTRDEPSAGAGNVYVQAHFTNRTAVSCTLYGFAGVQLLDGAGNPLPTQVEWGGFAVANEPTPALVPLAPSGSATLLLHWGQVPVGAERDCPVAQRVNLIPPGEYAPLTLVLQVRACGGGHIDVGPVHP